MLHDTEDPVRVYFLCGKIGSGKSWTARRLASRGATMVFNLDELMEPLFGQGLGRELYQRKLAICRDFLFGLADQALTAGLSVVFDYGFWSREDRRQAAERMRSWKQAFVYLPLDETEQLRRVEARNASADRTYAFTPEQLRQLNAFFEEPGEDEGLPFVRLDDLV
jgi:predicted kinase